MRLRKLLDLVSIDTSAKLDAVNLNFFMWGKPNGVGYVRLIGLNPVPKKHQARKLVRLSHESKRWELAQFFGALYVRKR